MAQSVLRARAGISGLGLAKRDDGGRFGTLPALVSSDDGVDENVGDKDDGGADDDDDGDDDDELEEEVEVEEEEEEEEEEEW